MQLRSLPLRCRIGTLLVLMLAAVLPSFVQPAIARDDARAWREYVNKPGYVTPILMAGGLRTWGRHYRLPFAPGGFLPLNSPSTTVYDNPEPSAWDLPQTWMDTRYNPGGTPLTWAFEITMTDSGNATTNLSNLQTQLTNAAARNGHTRIKLPNGWRSTGTHQLAKHTFTGSWTYVEWVNRDTPSLEGSLANPNNMTSAPIIDTTGGGSDIAITTLAGADRYRFTSVRVQKTNLGQGVGFLAWINSTYFDPDITHFGWWDDQDQVSKIPEWIIFDRVRFLGPNGVANDEGCLNAIAFHGINNAAVDCHFENIYRIGSESHGIICWQGPGPLKVVGNSFKNVGAICVMTGGADPLISGTLTRDIEWRRNNCLHEDFWNPRHPSWDGIARGLKALMELKEADRALLEGNVLSGSWQDGQDGSAFNIKSVDQAGGPASSWIITKNVTIRYNTVTRYAYFINIAAMTEGTLTDPWNLERIHVYSNLGYDWGTDLYNGNGIPTRCLGHMGNHTMRNIIVDHNTHVTTFASPNIGHYLLFSGNPKGGGFIITNNLGHRGSFGIWDANLGGEGTTSLNNQLAPGYICTKNGIIGIVEASYPAGNVGPASVAAIGFANYPLDPSIPSGTFNESGTDGLDFGCLVAKVQLATSGV